MVDLYFKDQLDPNNIKRIQKENNFQKPYPVEQFIMDFEAFVHIKEKLPDCVVKGGMAVPFHIQDKELRRLSVDIDIVTSHSRDQVIFAMTEVREKLKGKITIPENHVPTTEKEGKRLPLLTYYCDYKSNFQENAEIKIEIFYGNDLSVKTKEISKSEEIVGFNIDFPITIYDHGSLIGDKITTLPFNTIGIKPERELDVPKQIYDIGNLINSISEQVPTQEIINAFKKISHEEMSYYVNEPPSFTEILDDLVSFPDQLLIIEKDRLKLNLSYHGRFLKFTTELLGKAQYKEHTHLADILLIKIMGMLIRKHFNEGMKIKIINEKINEITSERNRILSLEPKAQTRELRSIVGRRGASSKEGKIIKNMFPVQAYLYDKILELE